MNHRTPLLPGFAGFVLFMSTYCHQTACRTGISRYFDHTEHSFLFLFLFFFLPTFTIFNITSVCEQIR